MTLPELEREMVKEFEEGFTYNPLGVFDKGKIRKTDFDALTIENVKSFLLTAIRKTAEKTREAIVPEMRKNELALDADGGDQIENDWSACVQEAEERYKRFIE